MRYVSRFAKKVKKLPVDTRTSVNRDVLHAYKIKMGCNKCGRKRGKLVFHHTEEGDKTANISDLLGKTKDILLKELQICVVLCERCHKRWNALHGDYRGIFDDFNKPSIDLEYLKRELSS